MIKLWRWWRMNWWRPWYRLRYGPQCGALSPWKSLDIKPCCVRTRTSHIEQAEGWHRDGYGYIWTETEWRWMAPVHELPEQLLNHPARTLHGMEEWMP